VIDAAEYARQVETYLCQKNGGHLVRVVGPAFDLVCGWAATGVPLKVAFRGIDRCCERHEAKGPRRRPVRIEFCEADVLDAFDDWRRAVGVGTAAVAGPASAPAAPARKPPLAAHIERAIARLANVRGTNGAAGDFPRLLDAIVRELEQMVVTASKARGDARAVLVSRLGELDRQLIDAAIRELDAGESVRLRAEAGEELATFAGRMPADARDRALALAFERLVRERRRLPVLRYD
jgi:hypothetical protein